MSVGWLILPVLGAAIAAFLHTRPFGRIPRGAELAHIKASPNWRDGVFHNLYEERPVEAENPLWEKGRKVPKLPLPTEKTELGSLDPRENVLIWLGHSSLYLQAGGKRILIDPVLSTYSSPLPWINRAFPGTTLYTMAEIPPVDLLLLSHDHWDHLDYATVVGLRERIGQVICPLGVGAHLQRWGFDPLRVQETDWYDTTTVGELSVHTTPSHHYSGRGLRHRKALWASYYIQGPGLRVFFSGDSAYSRHFRDIAKKYGPVDLALLENGQYDVLWAGSHMLPEQTADAARDLGAAVVLPIHNSRFCICRHPWDDPLTRLARLSQGEAFALKTPKIGQAFYYTRSGQSFSPWWERAGDNRQHAE